MIDDDMIERLTREDLLSLLDDQVPFHVTALAPFVPDRPDLTVQLLDALADRAATMLARCEVDRADIRRILGPLRAAAARLDPSGARGQGIALFASSEDCQSWIVKAPLEPRLVLAELPFVKPLLPLIGNQGQFELLVLSPERFELFAGTEEDIRPVRLHRPPPEIGAMMRRLDPLRPPPTETRLRLGLYFESFERALASADRAGPLVLAGELGALSLYREASRDPRVLPEGIPWCADPARLHSLARAIVSPRLSAAKRRSLAAFDSSASELRTTELDDVVLASVWSRVDTLFLDLEEDRFGQVDLATGEVDVLPEPTGEELTNVAAIQTLLHGGEVIALPTHEMPAPVPVAAVLRESE